MKTLFAAAALAATTATAITTIPTSVSAQGIYIGPRGGVGIGVGPGYGYGYRRGFIGPRVYEGRSAFRPGFRRGYRY